MNADKYFIQGFLFVFGLAPLPFVIEPQTKEKIETYWERVADYFFNVL